MSSETKIDGNVSFRPTRSAKIHELTMLYLNNQDLTNLSISEIAQKYTDIEQEFEKAFKEQHQNRVQYV